MTYIIKIEDNSEKAHNLINMLKAFKEDFDFIEISEDIPLPENVDKELDDRYAAFLKNPEGKDWEVLKKELL